MSNPIELTQEMLWALFDYCPETGELTWRKRQSRFFISQRVANIFKAKHAGKIAGSIGNHGYPHVRVFNKLYLSHRLIWLYVHGEWPEDQIDHINGNRSDNRIINLREVTHLENTRNTKRRIDNKSGYAGVYWCKRDKFWIASIGSGKTRKSLGYYKCVTAAMLARKAAEIRNQYHENHGRIA